MGVIANVQGIVIVETHLGNTHVNIITNHHSCHINAAAIRIHHWLILSREYSYSGQPT